ncbi:SH3 domain-containing protein [Metabacillus bambusae]|uniref:SH3 domain-containing protein n=1 Tax=Metabacillus bambusae TaxID=2795218 RepID=A0ABS3N0R0_9BACI|nr:SH3 domain-containing protein [Metabacillus bambusae]MBO1511814.1 SH3 domain-containing protein [Metabacillus bambusae]
METIINQVFWLWVPLSLLPVWLRIAIVTYLVIILSRPILLRLLPKLIEWASILLKKAIELLSYPLMVWINRFLTKRRHAGNYLIPAWIDILEDTCALLLKGLDKTEGLSQKRTRNKARLKKTFRVAAMILAILLPMAVMNNPGQAYSKTWYKFEAWATEEKVQKSLGFDLDQLQGKIQTTVESVSPTKLTLKAEYPEGGNIRQTPSLNGKIVADIKEGETVTYLDEEQTDDKGITWLKVETDAGKEGWVSERIVEEM